MQGVRAMVAHGGGPTAVLNASLAGLVDECRSSGRFASLEGARFGVRGLLSGDTIDLFSQPATLIEAVGQTPGSAIGSSRQKLGAADYERVLTEFRRRDVHWFFYTGGNGSMGTAFELERHARASGYDLGITGIPKTIDNDLPVTDHTPGYASTARFFAFAARDVGEDNRSLPSPICVLETLGRGAGWIVAATSFARQQEDDAPHLLSREAGESRSHRRRCGTRRSAAWTCDDRCVRRTARRVRPAVRSGHGPSRRPAIPAGIESWTYAGATFGREDGTSRACRETGIAGAFLRTVHVGPGQGGSVRMRSCGGAGRDERSLRKHGGFAPRIERSLSEQHVPDATGNRSAQGPQTAAGVDCARRKRCSAGVPGLRETADWRGAGLSAFAGIKPVRAKASVCR